MSEKFKKGSLVEIVVPRSSVLHANYNGHLCVVLDPKEAEGYYDCWVYSQNVREKFWIQKKNLRLRDKK